MLFGSTSEALPQGILSQALLPEPGDDVLLPIFHFLVLGLALGSLQKHMTAHDAHMHGEDHDGWRVVAYWVVVGGCG